MVLDEVLTRLRRDLEETFGADAAFYLMDRPRGGWDALATRDDLEGFATKVDLEGFATKADLERFATKADLERFATKADLERFATKADLERFATKDELEKTELRLERLLHEELRHQTWQLARLVAGAQGIVVMAIAAIGITLRFA